MDPRNVPEELQGLTQAEQMCIALANPIMRVMRLSGGQLGYRGHVVNVAQDVQTFAATLPRLGADIPILVVRRQGVEQGTHHDLLVRRGRVERALHWAQAQQPTLPKRTHR